MARSHRGMHGSRARERVLGRAGGVLLVLALVGCTADSPTPRVDREQAALRVTTVHGAQQLTDAQRAEVEGAVGEVLSGYLVGGFLGDYPRRFVEAFDDFTPRAAALGTRDITVLTAARVGEATEVTPQRLDARLSLLVHDDVVIGATAYLDVDLEAVMPGGDTQDVTLRGRLMLQEQRGQWSVYGFDVANNDGAVAEGAG